MYRSSISLYLWTSDCCLHWWKVVSIKDHFLRPTCSFSSFAFSAFFNFVAYSCASFNPRSEQILTRNFKPVYITRVISDILCYCTVTFVSIQFSGFDCLIGFIVLNTTFSNISAISRPVLVVEEAGLPRENHWPWASN